MIHIQDLLPSMEHMRLSSRMLLVITVMVMVSFSKMVTKLRIRSVFGFGKNSKDFRDYTAKTLKNST